MITRDEAKQDKLSAGSEKQVMSHSAATEILARTLIPREKLLETGEVSFSVTQEMEDALRAIKSIRRNTRHPSGRSGVKLRKYNEKLRFEIVNGKDYDAFLNYCMEVSKSTTETIDEQPKKKRNRGDKKSQPKKKRACIYKETLDQTPTEQTPIDKALPQQKPNQAENQLNEFNSIGGESGEILELENIDLGVYSRSTFSFNNTRNLLFKNNETPLNSSELNQQLNVWKELEEVDKWLADEPNSKPGLG